MKLCKPCCKKVKNIIEFSYLSLASLSLQELSIGGSRVKRVHGLQQVGESPSSSQQAKKNSLNRKSVKSGKMCLFIEGNQHHEKNLPKFRSIAPQHLAQFLQVGTVYKCGLWAGVSENMSRIYYCIALG